MKLATVSPLLMSKLENSVDLCTAQVNLFSNELKIVLAQIEIISKWIQGRFGIEIFDRESLELHHRQDFAEIKDIAQLLTSTVLLGIENPSENIHNSENKNKVQEGESDSKSESPQSVNTSLEHQQQSSVSGSENEDVDVDLNSGDPSLLVPTVCYDNASVKEEVTSDFNDTSTDDDDSDNSASKSLSKRKTRSSKTIKKTRSAPRPKEGGSVTSNDPAINLFQCDECGKIVNSLAYLNEHKKTHQEKEFKCNVCSKAFTRPSKLRRHSLIHMGEAGKRLQCRFCGKLFFVNRDVQRHERTHTGEKPNKCHVCPKAFNIKQHLTIHLRTHTGEKPYHCQLCNKYFTQANSLRLHKKLHEGKPYVPPSLVIKNAAHKTTKRIQNKKNAKEKCNPVKNTTSQQSS